jgi:teichuronic acid biosynthesis glycosyltransferase TuaC
MQMLSVLTLTQLFPNSVQPRHGVFVEERLRHLLGSGQIEARILAPVPWFPARGRAFGRYGTLARVPAAETRLGRTVRHPRYLTIPKVGMTVAPFLMAASLYREVRRTCRQAPRVQVIDSHFLYPDAVAACMLGAVLRIPVIMTARGSDVNVFTRHLIPRMLIRWAARRCARVITVSESLRQGLIALGVGPDHIVTLRNGVDLERFHPRDRSEARAAAGLTATTILSVGNLLELKGHHLVIESLAALPDVHAVIVGEGPMRAELATIADRCGVSERVRFVGNVPQAELVTFYSAADFLVLASSMEGMPNVVLESLACGTPVIATPVGGVGEILNTPAAGLVLRERSARAIAEAVTLLREAPRNPAAVRAHGATFGWGPTVQGLVDVIAMAAGSSQ